MSDVDTAAAASTSTQTASNDGYIVGIVILLVALCFVSGLLIYFVYKKYNDELDLSHQIIHQVARIKSRQMPKSGSVSKQTLDNIQSHAAAFGNGGSGANPPRRYLPTPAIASPDNKALSPSKPVSHPSRHDHIAINMNSNSAHNNPSSNQQPTHAHSLPVTASHLQNAKPFINPRPRAISRDQRPKHFQIQITQHQHNNNNHNNNNNNHQAIMNNNANKNARTAQVHKPAYKMNNSKPIPTPKQQPSAVAPPKPPIAVSPPAFQPQSPVNNGQPQNQLLPYHYFQKYIQPAMQRATGQNENAGEMKDGGIKKTELPPPPPPVRANVPVAANRNQHRHKVDKPSMGALSENASLHVPSLPVPSVAGHAMDKVDKNHLSVHRGKHSRMLTASTYLSALSDVTQSTAYTRITKDTHDHESDLDSEEQDDLSTIASTDSGHHQNRNIQYKQKEAQQQQQQIAMRPMMVYEQGYGQQMMSMGHMGMQIDGNVHALRQTTLYHQ